MAIEDALKGIRGRRRTERKWHLDSVARCSANRARRQQRSHEGQKAQTLSSARWFVRASRTVAS